MLALRGVVGDLTGYVASTFMRGVPAIQIPPSVMAMVDSSVGGKTAINVPAGKNLVGAFHQPRRVYADMDLLRSLEQREIDEGLAEAVKMGLIRRGSLFELMEEHVDAIRALERPYIQDVVHQAIELKAEVVALDEKEAGVRATLNFGHTIGHAIEGRRRRSCSTASASRSARCTRRCSRATSATSRCRPSAASRASSSRTASPSTSCRPTCGCPSRWA